VAIKASQRRALGSSAYDRIRERIEKLKAEADQCSIAVVLLL
jgi:hypothetical protein